MRFCEARRCSEHETARGLVQTYFPAAANRWYLGWVWISGATDYDGGNWGFSKAQAFLNTRVNFVTCTQ